MRIITAAVLTLAGCCLFLCSCMLYPGSNVFRSNNYVIIKGLSEPRTPDTLAQEFLGDKSKSWIIEESNQGISYQEGDTVIIPLKLNKAGLADDGFQVVPILCYHRFNEDCANPLCMPRSNFERQLSYLHEHGYRTISLKQLSAFLDYREAIPRKSVIITIDDGYRSVYTIAYPLLKKYGFTATLFIYTDFVGVSRNALTWEHLRELKAPGFEIGSHTISHSDLTKQAPEEDEKAYHARLHNELLRSKQILDQRLDQNTVFLAYPYGRFNDSVIKLTKQAGYKLAVSVKRRTNPYFADPFVLKRDQVLKRYMDWFAATVTCFQEVSLSLK